MTLDELMVIASSLQGAEETFPFGPDNLVYKINGKMFLLVSLDSLPLQFNAKCDPDIALQLREEFNGIKPGYHMNKKHWNTVIPAEGVPAKLVKELIKNSYDLVRKKK